MCSIYQYFTVFFLLLNNILLYRYTTLYLFTYQMSNDGHWGCFYFGAIANNAVMNIHVKAFWVNMLLFLLARP